MTKPRADVALLRLFRAVERGDCTAVQAYECFVAEYGGRKDNHIRKPAGLEDEMRQITGLKAEIRGRFLRFVLEE